MLEKDRTKGFNQRVLVATISLNCAFPHATFEHGVDDEVADSNTGVIFGQKQRSQQTWGK